MFGVIQKLTTWQLIGILLKELWWLWAIAIVCINARPLCNLTKEKHVKAELDKIQAAVRKDIKHLRDKIHVKIHIRKRPRSA